jgi:integrase
METPKMRVLSEGPVRITKPTIEAAWRRRAPKQRLILRDLECRGLALVVNPTGMTWNFSYRPRGIDPVTGQRPANRYVTIGNPSTHTPDAARVAVNQVKGVAASGGDPVAEQKAKQHAAWRERANTLDRLVAEYAKALPRRPKLRGTGVPSAAHVADELAQVRAAISGLGMGDRPAKAVTGVEVRRLIAALGDRPATARARFGALSRFFDWCQEENHIDANPCAMVTRSRRPKMVPARSHFLTLPVLARIWRAADKLAPVYRDLVRFLIAVPCRRGEAARLDWSNLDFAGAIWTIPGAITKNGDQHRLHLPPLLLALLLQRHREAGSPQDGLAFPAPQSGAPIDTFSAIKADLQTAAGTTGWRWHDFRRSFATALGEAGVAEPVADAVLNHRQSATRGGVLGVYQRAQRWPEQVRAMQAWNDALAAALSAISAAPRQRR